MGMSGYVEVKLNTRLCGWKPHQRPMGSSLSEGPAITRKYSQGVPRLFLKRPGLGGSSGPQCNFKGEEESSRETSLTRLTNLG